MSLIDRVTTRNFHRHLYHPMLEEVRLFKRKDDQRQGTVVTYTLYECRWGAIHKAGQTLAGDVVSNHKRTLHIPRAQLDDIGVHYLNPIDRFVDQDGRTWQPESTTQLRIKLMENHYCVDCLRVS